MHFEYFNTIPIKCIEFKYLVILNVLCFIFNFFRIKNTGVRVLRVKNSRH